MDRPPPHISRALHCRICRLDSAAMHTGVPKDKMRNMLVSGWAPVGRTPQSRRGKAEWSLNAGEGSSEAAGVQVTK